MKHVWHGQQRHRDVCSAKHASPNVIEQAIKAGPSSALFSRALWNHPGDVFPLATETVTVVATDGTGRRISLQEALERGIEGKIFTDGSCDQNWIRELKRASWAFVVTDDGGGETRS